MDIKEIETRIHGIPYSLSGSQDIGWIITFDDKRRSEIHLPAGTTYREAIVIAKTN